MKRVALVLFFAIAGFTAAGRADVQLNFEFFHSSLEPYGEWASAGAYGYVWHPRDVDEDWAPYTDGYWAYTDAGWTWVSYEDWGGITYHYGRWVRVGGLGWCWAPGYEWGPAWVSWRRSDDYIGWAPLPPEARWHRDTGFSLWVDAEFDIGPGYFRFCRVHDFGAPVLRHVLLPCHRNVTIIDQTFNITNITYRGDRGHVFNCGPDHKWVSARAARPVPALKLVQNTANAFVNAQQGNTLVMGMPAVAPGAATAIPKLASAPRTIAAPQIDRGWAGLAHDPARERIAAKFKQDAKGQTSKTAPAAAFDPAAVATIPKHAEPQARLPLHPSPPPAVAPSPVSPTVSKPRVPPAAITDPRNGRTTSDPGGNRSERSIEQVAPRARQSQPAVESPRREPVAPRAVAPEVFRRPVESPRAVERAPVTRPATPSTTEQSKGSFKGDAAATLDTTRPRSRTK